MEPVLKTIAEQAGLERVLFTPAMKQRYFEMAVAAGGKTLFKHVDTIRSGLQFAFDKAKDKKRALLICATYELAYGYDLLLRASRELIPIVVVAVGGHEPESHSEPASFLQYSQIGWLQFLTHTQQEAYDHLILGYQLFEAKKIDIPVLIFQACYPAPGEINIRENIDLGKPLTGFTTSGKTKGLDFDAALQAVKHKQEKPTLLSAYNKVVDALQEGYQGLGYDGLNGSLPFTGKTQSKTSGIFSLIPPQEEASILRPYCIRPFLPNGLVETLSEKKTLAVIEPKPSLGLAFPPFFSEMAASFVHTSIRMIPIVTLQTVLSNDQVKQAQSLLDTAVDENTTTPKVIELEWV